MFPRRVVVAYRRSTTSSWVNRNLSVVPMDSTAGKIGAKTSGTGNSTLTMQIVVRRDLLDTEGWGVGPLMAQAAHAATAVLQSAKDLDETKIYLTDIPNMRKVVLQTPDESSLKKLAGLLSAAEPPIAYYLWTEQPENVPTCLALAPNRRESRVKKSLDKASCRLWKG